MYSINSEVCTEYTSNTSGLDWSENLYIMCSTLQDYMSTIADFHDVVEMFPCMLVVNVPYQCTNNTFSTVGFRISEDNIVIL